MRKAFSRITMLLLIIGVVFLLLPTGEVVAATGILKQINFQGKVTNKPSGTNITDNSYNFTFSLYSGPSGGSPIWTETKSLTVTNGIFQTLLGDTTPLPGSVDFNTDNLYLGINFNSDGEMNPRVRMAAVPYAFNALKVAGLTVTDTTGTLTVANGEVISFGGSFSTSGTNDVAFTTSGATTLTLPTSGTLITLAGAEILTNKTIGSTGLTFSGAGTDLTTASNEALTLTAAGNGDLILSGDNDTNTQFSSTITSTSSQDLIQVSLTNQTSSGTQQALRLSNVDDAANAATEALIALENNEASSAVANGITFLSGGAGTDFTTGINFDAADLTTEIVLENAETISNQTDGTVAIGANSGTVTLQLSGTAATISNTSGALTLDSASGRVVVATGDFLSLGVSGVGGAAAGDIWYDTAAGKFKINEAGTTKTLCNLTDTGCGAGGGTTWDAIGDAGGNGAVAFGTTEQTMDWDFTTTDHDGMIFNFDNNGGTAGTDNGIVINNAVSTATTGDTTTESLLLIQQLDTTGTGTTTVDNGIKIDVAANAGMTDGIEITNSAGNLTNGITIVDTAGGTIGTGLSLSGTFTTAGINANNSIIINIGNAGTDFTATGGLNLADALNVSSGGLTITSGGATVTAGALAVNSDSITSDGTLTIDGTSSVVLGGGGNTFTFSETAGPTYAGTARPTKRVTLTPEFLGATLTPDGSDNTGTMTSDFCSTIRNINENSTPNNNQPCDADLTQEHSYYKWGTNQGSAQDYEVWVRWQVPSDFSEFSSSTAVSFQGWKTGSSSVVNLAVYDNDGDICGDGAALGTAGTWTSTNYDDPTACDGASQIEAGEIITFQVTLRANSSSDVAMIGQIDINYLARY